jgi:hypothetical protein
MMPAADYLRAQLERTPPPQGFVGTFPADEREALRAVAEKAGYLFAWREVDAGNISVHCDRKAT